MGIKHFTVFDGDDGLFCSRCDAEEELVFDDDGTCYCTDCLFEKESREGEDIEDWDEWENPRDFERDEGI